MSLDAATITKQLNAHAVLTHSNVVRQPTGLLQGWLASWRFARRVRRDAAWLQNQPDYLLHDIGVSRADIEAIVRHGRF